MNNKGFTLIEVLAVVAIIAIIGAVSVPGVINTINNSKKSSYRMMIKNIKTASSSLFEEVEFGDSNLYQYTASGVKSGSKLEISKVDSDNQNLEVYQIITNLQTLLSNGFLKGTTKEKNGRKVLSLNNPLNDKDIGFCQIVIRKVVDRSSSKSSYEVIGNSKDEACPSTDLYQGNLESADVGVYSDQVGSRSSYSVFRDGTYQLYQKILLKSSSSNVSLDAQNSLNFNYALSLGNFYGKDSNSNLFFFQRSSSVLLSSSLLSLSVGGSRNYQSAYVKNSSGTIISGGTSYPYASTANYNGNGGFFNLEGSIASSKIPKEGQITCNSTSISCSSLFHILKVNLSSTSSISNSTNKRYLYNITDERVYPSRGSSQVLFLGQGQVPYGTSYQFNSYNGTYTLENVGTFDWNTGRSNIVGRYKYTCLGSSSCSSLYEVLSGSTDTLFSYQIHRKG